MSQCEQILNYMKEYGPITQKNASDEFGCTRLAARISDLEKQGYNIEHKKQTSKNRYGKNVTYMSYSLA